MKLKKYCAVIISMAIMLNVVSTTAFAVNGDAAGERSIGAISLQDIDGYLNSEYFKSLGSNEQQKVLDKLSIFTSGVSACSTVTKHTFGMTQCEQVESFFCGPATVQQTLLQLVGSVFRATQYEIANDIGTTCKGSVLSNMCDYVNDNNEFCYYIIVTNPTLDGMKNILTCDIPSYVPIMCRLKIVKGGNWIYDSSGHYMNANGFDFSGTTDMVYVTDPWVTVVDPTHNGSYWITLEELHTATTTHFAQEIAY